MFQNKNLAVIKSNKLFTGLEEKEIKLSISQKDFVDKKEGEIIYQNGDPSEYMYLIFNGEVKIKMTGSGGVTTIVTKRKDEFFGEHEFIESVPRRSSAVAMTDSSFFLLKGKEFKKLISKNQQVAVNLQTYSGLEEIHEEPAAITEDDGSFDTFEPRSTTERLKDDSAKEEALSEESREPEHKEELREAEPESLTSPEDFDEVQKEWSFTEESSPEQAEETPPEKIESTDELKESLLKEEGIKWEFPGEEEKKEAPQVEEPLPVSDEIVPAGEEHVETPIPQEQKKGLTVNQLHEIIKAAQKVNSNIKLDDVLKSIVEVATTLTDAERGTLYIVDKERRELWSKVIKGNEVTEIRLKFGEGLAGYAASANEVLNIKDVKKDSRFNPEFDKASGFKTKNMLCFPINNKEDEVIGVLQLINNRKGAFTDLDEEFLSALSINAALALENAAMVEKLLQSDRLLSLGKMANFLIQDIKKPILTVKHYAEHIRKKNVSQDVNQILEMLIEQANSVVNLVQTTLGYSEGKTILETRVQSLHKVLDEILDLLAEYVESRSAKIFKKYEEDVKVNVDKKELYQALYQIVKNACDAMTGGGNIFISAAKGEKSALISIKDSGLGIPDSIKDRIFEPFMSHGKKQGVGLGLSIAEKIVKDHGGEITVESDLGEGAAFIISLPAIG